MNPITIPLPFFGRLHADENNKILVTNSVSRLKRDPINQIHISIEVGRVKSNPELLPLLGEIVGCKPARNQKEWTVEKLEPKKR